jgi:hypothetical protein
MSQPPVYPATPGDFGHVTAAVRDLLSALDAGDPIAVSRTGDALRLRLGGTDNPTAEAAVIRNPAIPPTLSRTFSPCCPSCRT